MIAALLKAVDLRVEIDPLTGEPAGHRAAAWGASPADLAALETALQLAGEGPGRDEVVVVSAGPAETAAAREVLLRDALAAGATRAVRLEIAAGSSSAQVAEAVAPVVAGARFVICGDASLDRGSGAVPAFVAARLAAAQALGLTGVSVVAGALLAERRLDGGRRERLRVEAPAVLSIEAGLRLRRAPLGAVIAARSASIDVLHASSPPGHGQPHPEHLRPYRAPARPLAAPAGSDPRDRVLALTGMLAPARARRVVEADAATCAEELLNYLSERGYR